MRCEFMISKRAPLLGFLWVAVLLTGGIAASDSAADVQVDNAWIRWLPAGLPNAGYMTLLNKGSADRLLIAVSSPAYGEVSIHQSLEAHGVSSMRPVDSIALKPHAVVRFAEGGYHLMLMQPGRPVHPGDKVVMTLHFAEGPPVDVIFSVRAGG
jgi:copper(I)-binding protein